MLDCDLLIRIFGRVIVIEKFDIWELGLMKDILGLFLELGLCFVLLFFMEFNVYYN